MDDESQAGTAARDVFEHALAWQKKWDTPTLVLGWAATLFSIFLLISVGVLPFLPDLNATVAAVISAGGTVITGAPFLYVSRQRHKYQKLVAQAMKNVHECCAPAQTALAIQAL